MPIYSYKCNNCEKIFDRFEKPGSNKKVLCPDCNSEALRIFSPVGIVFKGSGFYSTDYNSKSAKPASENKVDKSVDKPDSNSSKKDQDKEQIKDQKAV
jgi:putative FmdB family regulatory protein